MTQSGVQHASARGPQIVVLAGFLALNVVLGGAIFGAPQFDLILQVTACGILSWCVIDRTGRKLGRSAIVLIAILAAALFACLVQLAPLPFDLWKVLPGREEPARILELVRASEAVLPLSLAPQATLEALFWLLPPAAALALVLKLDIRSAVTAGRWTIPLLAAAGALLGIAQVVAVDTVSLYLHEGPARGHAAGFFQVVNYQSTLLLIGMPFLAVLFSRLGTRFETGDAYLAQGVLLGTLLLVLVAGLAAAGSFTGYVLAIPVLLASLPIALHRGMSLPVFGGVLVLVGCLAAAALYVAGSPLLTGAGTTDFGSGPLSRLGSWAVASEMARDYFPVGAGIGAFRDAYGAYEDPTFVTEQFVAHAHNDYLEILGELGLPGLLVLIGVVGWWLAVTIALWRRPMEEGLRTRRAASIAVAVVLLHSLVDSPARTEAIACLTAFCLALMASAPVNRPRSENVVMSHRHIEL